MKSSELFWKVRFKKFPTLKGAGHFGKSLEQNEREYQAGFENIIYLLKGTNIADLKILEIGCGIGYHAKLFKSLGAKDYTCLDITDVLFDDLKKKLDANFIKLDITQTKLCQTYDLILMLDVTQHIVSDSDFVFAMNNIKTHLNDNGIIIITSFLTREQEQVNFYEVKRTLANYKEVFSDCKISSLLQYRDKWVMKIEK